MRTLGRAVWWVRQERPAAGPAAGADAGPPTVVVHCMTTDERPDRSVVDVADLPPGRAVASGRSGRVVVHAETLQLLRSELLGAYAAGAPALVLVEHVRREAPVTAELVAFAHDDVAERALRVGAGVAPGAVLTQADARRLGLDRAEQRGAVRWLAATGQVLEIYVAPAHRRQRVATSLVLAAEGAAAVRGWPRLWAGGVRTALGEAMLRAWPWGRARSTALTELAPPMTPPVDAVGAPQRALHPDA